MRKKVALSLIFIFAICGLFVFAHSSVAQVPAVTPDPTRPGKIGGVCKRDKSADVIEEVKKMGIGCDLPLVGGEVCKAMAGIVTAFRAQINPVDYASLPALMCDEGRPSIVTLEGAVVGDINDPNCHCRDPFSESAVGALKKICAQQVLNLNKSDIDLAADALTANDGRYGILQSPDVKGLVEWMLIAENVPTINPMVVNIDTLNKLIKELKASYQVDEGIYNQYMNCMDCAKREEYFSGIGCIPTKNISEFIRKGVFDIGLGIAGSVALGFLIYGAIQLQTSQGDSKKIQAAKDTMRNAIIGLLVIIFSVFIIRFIAETILKINVF